MAGDFADPTDRAGAVLAGTPAGAGEETAPVGTGRPPRFGPLKPLPKCRRHLPMAQQQDCPVCQQDVAAMGAWADRMHPTDLAVDMFLKDWAKVPK